MRTTESAAVDSVQATMLGCGLMLAGLAAENLDARRWRTAGHRTPIDALTMLTAILPFAGLIVIAAVNC
jgi:hypothetical protein